MGGSKTKQQQQQQYQNTSTYGHAPGASSADIDAVRDFEFSHDPRVTMAFSRAYGRAKDTYANPLGGATTPQLRDATLRATGEDLAQQEAQAYAEEDRGLQGLEFAKRMDVAQMTAPRLVQTGQSGSSSGTSNTQQTQSPVNSIISGASGLGAALIM